MLIIINPKATVTARFPKAKCTKNWSTQTYLVTLGEPAPDFNGNMIDKLQTNSGNPAEAWEQVCLEFRLEVFAELKPRTSSVE